MLFIISIAVFCIFLDIHPFANFWVIQPVNNDDRINLLAQCFDDINIFKMIFDLFNEFLAVP